MTKQLQTAPAPVARKARPAKGKAAKKAAVKAEAKETKTEKPADKPTETVQPEAKKSRTVPVRLVKEILGGAPKANDWRDQLQGRILDIHHFVVDKPADRCVADPDRTDYLTGVMLAIPRDDDVGKGGPAARNSGYIAVHAYRDESGEGFVGQPYYLRHDEILGLVAEKDKKSLAKKLAKTG